jgi:hypothetical protein
VAVVDEPAAVVGEGADRFGDGVACSCRSEEVVAVGAGGDVSLDGDVGGEPVVVQFGGERFGAGALAVEAVVGVGDGAGGGAGAAAGGGEASGGLDPVESVVGEAGV